jgi:16S rRNA (adenine1518-N6/adenine1519-N6)-dimethyltransferase
VPITNLSELREFLRSLGITPQRKLSQNFLIDSNIVQKIVAQGDIQPQDTILEIGPGPGALTERLVAYGVHVYAVEKDRILAEALKRFSKVMVFTEDIQEFDLNLLPAKTKVIANLPYHLTTPILGLLVPRYDLFSTITVMVQEEVARRMTAQAKSPNYSALTVFLRFYTELFYAFKVSRNCFYPRPKVDSAVVSLSLKVPPPVDAEAFFALVHKVFQHRRKMVKTILGPSVESVLVALGENPWARPEELSLESFLRLYTHLKAHLTQKSLNGEKK